MTARVRAVVASLALAAALAPAAAAVGVPISVDRGAVQVARHGGAPEVFRPAVTAAAWYQPDPLCGTPLGCGFLELPALSPYPKGTFHVGTAIGRQLARAFIAVRIGKQAAAADSGTLSIPLDTNPTDGSIAPQTARINVCVVYQAVTDVEGAFDGAPSANCLPAARARYVAKPAPHLAANLDRLAGHLAGVKGFALLPADASPTAAWDVVFKLPSGKASASALPRLELVVNKVLRPVEPPAGVHHHHATTEPAGGSPSADLDGAPATEPTLPPTVSSQPPPNPMPVVARPVRAARFVTVGYQYPELWLLPLVLIVLVPFTARALTKDLAKDLTR